MRDARLLQGQLHPGAWPRETVESDSTPPIKPAAMSKVTLGVQAVSPSTVLRLLTDGRRADRVGVP
jgi:hypothetical protein